MKAALIPGLVLLAALWSPLPDLVLPVFAAHMVRHMGLVALVAPLLVLGVPPLARVLAVPPLLAAVAEFCVVWAWHLPRAHGLAYVEGWGFALEQGSFLLAGLLTWAGCLRATPLAGAGGMLLTSMHMTLLGALLILAPRDLYAAWCGTAPNLSGQQLGGMLMLALGTPVYLFAGLAMTARALREQPA